MIRSAVNWFRPVMPPAWVVGVFVFAYLFVGGFGLWVVYGLGLSDEAEAMLRVGNAVAGIGAAAFALFRVCYLHPLFRADYRRWLAQTPWTSRRPLPAGPVHLVPQDLVVLGILVLPFHDLWPGVLLVPALFLAVYLGMLCVTFWLTGPRWMGYALAFGMGLVGRLAVAPAAAMALLVLLYPLALFGLRLALARFPWKMPEPWESLALAYRLKSQPGGRPLLGWPWDSLRADRAGAPVNRRDALLAPLLVGWWVYAIVATTPDPEVQRKLSTMILVGTAVLSFFGRIALYLPGHCQPISLWGRIRTGRWVLPGYDKVLVAPVLALLLPILVAALSVALRLGSPEIVIPVGVTVILLVALNMGPSLARWRLTGRHRIGPMPASSQEVVRL